MKILTVFSLLAISLTVLSTVSARAQGQDPLPKVSCNLMYSKVDSNGISVDFENGPNVTISETEAVSATRGFTLKAHLVRNCPSDGPCSSNDFNLEASVTKDISKAGLNVHLVPGQYGFARWSSSLDVGPESGFLNCDLDTFADSSTK